MKQEQIKELFERHESICYVYNDIECWRARELQDLLGYGKWENFEKVIQKAKDACLKCSRCQLYTFLPKDAESWI